MTDERRLDSVDPDDIDDVEPIFEDLASTELEDDETDDPTEAAEEGLPWVPPIDPPEIGTEDDGDPELGAGFGVSGREDPFDADHHAEPLSDPDEVTARVIEALRADSFASRYADDLTVDTEGRVAIVDGIVDDLDDEDQIVELISEVPGITEVVSRIRVRALE